MTDTVTATPKAATPKVKKVAKPKVPAAHPKYIEMVATAVAALKERGGSSRQAILKYISANFKVESTPATNSHLKLALKSGVKAGTLKQAKGTGASGSFKLGEKPKKVAKKATKPKAAKPKVKKTAAKKPAAKKTAAKKPAAKKAKSPKKAAAKPKAAAKKPAAKKTAAKKTPKKAAAKKPAAKKPAAKKTKTPKKAAAKK